MSYPSQEGYHSGAQPDRRAATTYHRLPAASFTTVDHSWISEASPVRTSSMCRHEHACLTMYFTHNAAHGPPARRSSSSSSSSTGTA
jgi:hypothetical protein